MMEQHTVIDAVQDDNPTPAVSLGRTLREAREHFGMSVADVSGQIKLTVRQIEALEADDFRHLPEMPFLRGFVRCYAKLLRLDAQPLLALLPNPDTVKLLPDPVKVLFPGVYTFQRHNLIWLGAAMLLAVLVVALAVWHFMTPPVTMVQVGIPTPLPPIMKTIPPVAGAPAPPAASAAQAVVAQPAVPAAGILQAEPQTLKTEAQPVPQAASLLLVFDAASWVEIRDRNDRILSSQLNPRGSELRLNGDPPFSLAIGHAASVRLYHRGKQVDLTPYIKPSSEVARLTLK